MKFVKTSYTKLKKGDYVKFVPNNIPALALYGYVRIHSGEKWVQSKNAIQTLSPHKYLNLKPKKDIRFYKTRLKNKGTIFILHD